MTPTPSEFALSRRALLQSAAASAIPLLAGNALSAAETEKGYVDAHVHIWTPDVKTYPLAKGYKVEEMQPASFTADELFKECRPAGVTRVVLIQMNFYEYDNRYVLDAIKKHPDVFRGVAIVDEKQPNVCQTMADLAKQGVTGFRLYATREAVEGWLKSSEVNAMFACGAKTNQAMCLLANPDALPAIRELVKKHPDTRVVIDHFARIGISGTVNQSDLDALCSLAEFRNVYIKTSAFYALGKKKAPYTDLGPMIRRLRDVFGASRLMWASDCPFQVVDGHTYRESIALVREKLDFLSDDDKAWLLSKTAESVYWPA